MAVSDYMFFERWSEGHRIVVQMVSNENPWDASPWVCYCGAAYDWKGNQVLDFESAFDLLSMDEEWRAEEWRKIEVFEGQSWCRKWDGEIDLEDIWQILSMREVELEIGKLDNGMIRAETLSVVPYGWLFHNMALSLEDDDPSYTEGYRAGCSGLRWL